MSAHLPLTRSDAVPAQGERWEAAQGDGGEDNRSIASFIAAKLPKPPDDMLRFFDRNSYYSLHGRDAHTVAAEYFKSSSCVRYAGDAANARSR